MSSIGQDDPLLLPANETGDRDTGDVMSVTAKRADVFALPVLISVRGWFGRQLPQIRCGIKALRTRPLAPRPANDQ
jgi:hypothetical protein